MRKHAVLNFFSTSLLFFDPNRRPFFCALFRGAPLHLARDGNERLAGIAQRDGAAGVAFFFVLSGFILTYNYHSSFTKLSLSTAKKFYAARIARIAPVTVLTFLLFLPLMYQQLVDEPGVWLCRALTNLSFTQSFVPLETYYFSYNAVSWSLSDELFFCFDIDDPSVLVLTAHGHRDTMSISNATWTLSGLAYKATSSNWWLFYSSNLPPL